jgi:hypothetical protein
VIAASSLLAAVPTSASAAAAPARLSQMATVTAAAVHGCPSGDFCIYPGTDFTGTMTAFSRCQQFHFIPFVGTGSFVNNQADGTRAAFYDQNKLFLNFTAPAYAQNANKNWTSVFYVIIC